MNKILVLQSDFGIVDGAVSAMIGVSLSVDPELKIYDLSHSITPYQITEASYRLFQSIQYWPVGTVFVSVVDPGVGSKRTSVVVLTDTGHYIVTPNNGSLTHVKNFIGIRKVVLIDVKAHRHTENEQNYTFDGRDLFARLGAKLASGQLTIEACGKLATEEDVVELPLPPSIRTDHSVTGGIEIFDERFGSLWSSIQAYDFMSLKPQFNDVFRVRIIHNKVCVFDHDVKYGKAFNDVPIGSLVLYINSINRLSLAINQGNLAETYALGNGLDWVIEVSAGE
jgi:S-adenosylmethionine hydrolase